MADLKIHVQSRLCAHVCVHTFKEIVLFESEAIGYEIVSKCQGVREDIPSRGVRKQFNKNQNLSQKRPRGHPPWWGTETQLGFNDR